MRKVTRTLIASAAALGLAAAAISTASAHPASAPLKGQGKNMKIVANIPYAGGTDMEFATIKGHDYAFAASAPGVGGAKAGALHVINVDNPEKPKLVAQLDCSIYQGDIQISYDKKTLMIGADSAGGPDSCLAVGKLGFMTIDISNPLKPKPVGFAEIKRGSHNITAHPTKPYVYNSDSDLANTGLGVIEIWSIKNPAKPEKVGEVKIGVHSSHDISFNSKGTMAVTAAVSHFDLLDTTDPENPALLYTGQCPGCSITHDAKFTPDDSTIIIGDEGGGGGTYPCPGGALYFYSLQASRVPVLEGAYEPGEVVFASGNQGTAESCTAHVFDISDDGSHVAISWYSAGSRYLDVSNPVGPTFGENGTGVKEAGWFEPTGGVSWSSKFYKGPYIYSNDENRGFDVFKILKP